MNILTVEKLHKSFGNKILFDDITFGINEGDKIGIIGVNGTGKSTLLKIIAGVEKGDSGQIVTMNGLKIAYLPQSPAFHHKGTVLQQVFESNDETMKLVRDYETAITNNLSDPSDAYWEKQVAILTEQMDKQKAWSLESEAKTILTKLGITQFQQQASQLSGGQRKRVALARVLISPVDLLILDEPTNHIDNDTVEWLEKHLSHYTKALIMVTHDRYFLDRVANRTIELEQGKLYPYEGNYSKYLELKAEREELLQAGERKRQNFLRTELEWVRRGAQARSTKQKARLQRFEEIASQKAPEQRGNVEISAASSRLGKKIIIAEHISKSYDYAEKILNENNVSEETKQTLLSAIKTHHGALDGKYDSLVAEVVANADCYRFLTFAGTYGNILFAAKSLSLGKNDSIDFCLNKIEEKLSILSLDKAKLDLTKNYEAIKAFLNSCKE